MGVASDARWKLTVDGTTQPRHEALGWANGWSVTAGRGTATYETSPVRLLVVAAQVVAWVVALVLVLRRWRRRR